MLFFQLQNFIELQLTRLNTSSLKTNSNILQNKLNCVTINSFGMRVRLFAISFICVWSDPLMGNQKKTQSYTVVFIWKTKTLLHELFILSSLILIKPRERFAITPNQIKEDKCLLHLFLTVWGITTVKLKRNLANTVKSSPPQNKEKSIKENKYINTAAHNRERSPSKQISLSNEGILLSLRHPILYGKNLHKHGMSPIMVSGDFFLSKPNPIKGMLHPSDLLQYTIWFLRYWK